MSPQCRFEGLFFAAILQLPENCSFCWMCFILGCILFGRAFANLVWSGQLVWLRYSILQASAVSLHFVFEHLYFLRQSVAGPRIFLVWVLCSFRPNILHSTSFVQSAVKVCCTANALSCVILYTDVGDSPLFGVLPIARHITSSLNA